MPRYFRISNGQIVNNTEGGREKKEKKRKRKKDGIERIRNTFFLAGELERSVILLSLFRYTLTRLN